MRQRLDVARRRDILARWCNLAEQRLEHLTELFETGRWRRYHTEQSFLENIQEARSVVEIWRRLSMSEASLDNEAARASGASRGDAAADASWPGHISVTLPRGDVRRDPVRQVSSPSLSFPPQRGRRPLRSRRQRLGSHTRRLPCPRSMRRLSNETRSVRRTTLRNCSTSPRCRSAIRCYATRSRE